MKKHIYEKIDYFKMSLLFFYVTNVTLESSNGML